MRPDMGKVLTERPRKPGYKVIKGSTKKFNKSLENETYITKESMTKPWLKGWDAKVDHKTDVIGPLYGYIKSKVGQKWDDVYSEIRQNIDINTNQGSHLFDHIKDMVELNVVLVDGKPHVVSNGYRTIASHSDYVPLESYGRRPQYYVCPISGILKLAPNRTSKKQKQSQNWVWKDKEKLTQYRLVPCGKTQTLIWFEVQLAPLRYYTVDQQYNYKVGERLKRLTFYDVRRMHPVYDMVLKKDFSDGYELFRIYGGEYYAVSKRQLNKKEIASLKKQ